MLDQNTDRMWYVIGAVIVGAAIIFLVNSSFPQLFASVGDTFTKKSDDVNEIVSDLSPNGIIDPGIVIGGLVPEDFSLGSNGGNYFKYGDFMISERVDHDTPVVVSMHLSKIGSELTDIDIYSRQKGDTDAELETIIRINRSDIDKNGNVMIHTTWKNVRGLDKQSIRLYNRPSRNTHDSDIKMDWISIKRR